MLALDLNTEGFDRQLKLLTEMPDIIRKVVVGALSDTVDDIHARQTLEMKRSFNNPTPYVVKGLKKRYSGGKMGQGVTKMGTYFEFFPTGKSPEDIVRPHVFGGQRKVKRSERRMQQFGILPPGSFTVMGNDYPRNGSGDIPGARYTQMLNQLGALSDVARSQMGKNKQRNRKGTSYYVVKRSGVPIAIAERNGEQTRIMLVFAKSTSYKKRYDFFGVGKKQLDYSLPLHFNRILKRYMSRL